MTTHSLTRYPDTVNTLRRSWEKEIGIRCNVSEVLSVPHSRGGSLGPSINSMFPDWNVPKTWFLTAAHIFEYPETKFNYSFALEHREVQNYVDDHVGKLIGVNKEQQLAVVEINSCKINLNDLKKVKVTYNSYIPCIRGLGIDDFDIVRWDREIYKSGATTGLTSGTLSSWGVRVNPSCENGPEAKSPFIIVRKDKFNFSEEGDSGGSVFFINNYNEATILGILEEYWDYHFKWHLSAVTPFFLKELKEWIMELRNDNASLGSDIDDFLERFEPSDRENVTNSGCCID